MKKNTFKQLDFNNSPQLGLWNGLVDTYVAEILAGSGFDWVLIDGEHAPFDLRTIVHQLQAMAAFDVPVLVRPPKGDAVVIKQLLDTGVQNLVVPMVETAEQATMLYKAMQYAPKGIRGVGTALARAAQWNRTNNYYHSAGDEMCLIVQVESVKGIENLDAILAVEGVEGVFIGPADLAATMGHLGNPNHPEVQAAIAEALHKIRTAQKIAGIMATVKATADAYIEQGANMIAVGIDTLLLAKASTDLLAAFKNDISNHSNTTY